MSMYNVYLTSLRTTHQVKTNYVKKGGTLYDIPSLAFVCLSFCNKAKVFFPLWGKAISVHNTYFLTRCTVSKTAVSRMVRVSWLRNLLEVICRKQCGCHFIYFDKFDIVFLDYHQQRTSPLLLPKVFYLALICNQVWIRNEKQRYEIALLKLHI